MLKEPSVAKVSAFAAVLAWLLFGSFNIFIAAQYSQEYESARSVVQRTQDDLGRTRREGPRNSKERERIDNARKHLSDFDRNLSKSRFNKDRLDSAIDDLKNIVEHNTLEAADRDRLMADLTELRRIRATRGV